jgi:hypothetical protein
VVTRSWVWSGMGPGPHPSPGFFSRSATEPPARGARHGDRGDGDQRDGTPVVPRAPVRRERAPRRPGQARSSAGDRDLQRRAGSRARRWTGSPEAEPRWLQPPPCAVATVTDTREAMYLSVGAHDVPIDVPCVLMAIDGICAGWWHSRLITTSK